MVRPGLPGRRPRPGAVRRSTWAEGDVGASERAYVDFVRHRREMGFTDFSVVPPADADLPALHRIARDRIPELRADFA